MNNQFYKCRTIFNVSSKRNEEIISLQEIVTRGRFSIIIKLYFTINKAS